MIQKPSIPHWSGTAWAGGKGFAGICQYINPMDMNLNYSDDDNPLSLKADFILSLCELIVGGKNGLEPVEKTIIDRCVRLVYQEYLADPVPEKMPILEDLYNLLRNRKSRKHSDWPLRWKSMLQVL